MGCAMAVPSKRLSTFASLDKRKSSAHPHSLEQDAPSPKRGGGGGGSSSATASTATHAPRASEQSESTGILIHSSAEHPVAHMVQHPSPFNLCEDDLVSKTGTCEEDEGRSSGDEEEERESLSSLHKLKSCVLLSGAPDLQVLLATQKKSKEASRAAKLAVGAGDLSERLQPANRSFSSSFQSTSSPGMMTTMANGVRMSGGLLVSGTCLVTSVPSTSPVHAGRPRPAPSRSASFGSGMHSSHHQVHVLHKRTDAVVFDSSASYQPLSSLGAAPRRSSLSSPSVRAASLGPVQGEACGPLVRMVCPNLEEDGVLWFSSRDLEDCCEESPALNKFFATTVAKRVALRSELRSVGALSGLSQAEIQAVGSILDYVYLSEGEVLDASREFYLLSEEVEVEGALSLEGESPAGGGATLSRWVGEEALKRAATQPAISELLRKLVTDSSASNSAVGGSSAETKVKVKSGGVALRASPESLAAVFGLILSSASRESILEHFSTLLSPIRLTKEVPLFSPLTVESMRDLVRFSSSIRLELGQSPAAGGFYVVLQGEMCDECDGSKVYGTGDFFGAESVLRLLRTVSILRTRSSLVRTPSSKTTLGQPPSRQASGLSAAPPRGARRSKSTPGAGGSYTKSSLTRTTFDDEDEEDSSDEEETYDFLDVEGDATAFVLGRPSVLKPAASSSSSDVLLLLSSPTLGERGSPMNSTLSHAQPPPPSFSSAAAAAAKKRKPSNLARPSSSSLSTGHAEPARPSALRGAAAGKPPPSRDSSFMTDHHPHSGSALLPEELEESAASSFVSTRNDTILLRLPETAAARVFARDKAWTADFELRVSTLGASFEAFLFHPVGRHYFGKHLEKQFANESLDFWIETRRFVDKCKGEGRAPPAPAAQLAPPTSLAVLSPKQQRAIHSYQLPGPVSSSQQQQQPSRTCSMSDVILTNKPPAPAESMPSPPSSGYRKVASARWIPRQFTNSPTRSSSVNELTGSLPTGLLPIVTQRDGDLSPSLSGRAGSSGLESPGSADPPSAPAAGGSGFESYRAAVAEAVRLCDQFVLQNAPRQINVQSSTREAIQKYVDGQLRPALIASAKPPSGEEEEEEEEGALLELTTLFDQARDEIERLMMTDAFPRFRRSEAYREAQAEIGLYYTKRRAQQQPAPRVRSGSDLHDAAAAFVGSLLASPKSQRKRALSSMEVHTVSSSHSTSGAASSSTTRSRTDSVHAGASSPTATSPTTGGRRRLGGLMAGTAAATAKQQHQQSFESEG